MFVIPISEGGMTTLKAWDEGLKMRGKCHQDLTPLPYLLYEHKHKPHPPQYLTQPSICPPNCHPPHNTHSTPFHHHGKHNRATPPPPRIPRPNQQPPGGNNRRSRLRRRPPILGSFDPRTGGHSFRGRSVSSRAEVPEGLSVGAAEYEVFGRGVAS